jgi:hypothetical protein
MFLVYSSPKTFLPYLNSMLFNFWESNKQLGVEASVFNIVNHYYPSLIFASTLLRGARVIAAGKLVCFTTVYKDDYTVYFFSVEFTCK